MTVLFPGTDMCYTCMQLFNQSCNPWEALILPADDCVSARPSEPGLCAKAAGWRTTAAWVWWADPVQCATTLRQQRTEPSSHLSGGLLSATQSPTHLIVRSWFLILLAKPEFHSYLASWWVVIRTPVLSNKRENVVYCSLQHGEQHNWLEKILNEKDSKHAVFFFIYLCFCFRNVISSTSSYEALAESATSCDDRFRDTNSLCEISANIWQSLVYIDLLEMTQSVWQSLVYIDLLEMTQSICITTSFKVFFFFLWLITSPTIQGRCENCDACGVSVCLLSDFSQTRSHISNFFL
jgi:hypothetical protein